MLALTTRLSADAVPDLGPMLTSGNLQTQLTAVHLIEETDDGRYATAVVDWLVHRLRTPRRSSIWGLYEVSGVLRDAIRGGALPQVARALEEHHDPLQPEETHLLDRAWPPASRARFLETPDPALGRDAAAVLDWYEMSAAIWSDKERPAELEEDVGPIIERLSKRRQRATS
jgi:hypothetical protein